MIVITKSFSEGKIDISHLSPRAQKRIIAQERKKIELDQKIADTKNSIAELKQRASMSISDNSKIGAMKLKRNPMMGFTSSVGSMAVAQEARSKIGTLLAKASPKISDSNLVNSAAFVGTSMLANSIVPWAIGAAGKLGGAVRGLTAQGAARRKERKLERLSKKRAKL